MSQPPMPPGPPTQPLPQPQFQTWPLQGTPPSEQPPPTVAAPTRPCPSSAAAEEGEEVRLAHCDHHRGGCAEPRRHRRRLSGDGTATTAEPNATVTVTETAEDESNASKAPSPKKTTEPEPESTMERGHLRDWCGRKARPIQNQVPEDSSGCYWEKLKDDSGGLDSIIANGEVNAGGRVSITLKRGQFFQSEDCGTWKRV